MAEQPSWHAATLLQPPVHVPPSTLLPSPLGRQPAAKLEYASQIAGAGVAVALGELVGAAEEASERVSLAGAGDGCSLEAEFINALLGFTVRGPVKLMAEGLKQKPLADIAPLLQTMEHAVRRTHVVLSEVAQLATDAGRFCNVRIGKVPGAATGAQVTVGFVARGAPCGVEVAAAERTA